MDAGNLYKPDPKSDPTYFAGINEHLVAQVRPDDRVILDVGCANGRLGEKLKSLRLDRIVYGIERIGPAADQARVVLDAVFQSDVTRDIPPIEAGTLDCIIFGDVLEHIYDPVGVLVRLKPLLRPSGRFLCSIPNFQHFSALSSLVAGDFQYQQNGLLDRDHLRFFGVANVQKMFLDAGCLPRFPDAIRIPIAPEVLAAYTPLLAHLKLNVQAFADKASIYQHICTAEPLPDISLGSESITFISPVTDIRSLQDNLMASPLIRSGRHEFIPVCGATSASDTLRLGLANSRSDCRMVVLVQPDVYLPSGWDDRLLMGVKAAEAHYGAVGVAGVLGVTSLAASRFERAGRTLRRSKAIATAHALPIQAVSLDEMVLAFPRTAGILQQIPADLGFHMYGSAACMEADDAGLAAVIIDAPCLHNTEASEALDAAFVQAAQCFARNWYTRLPYATTLVEFKSNGQIAYW